MDFNFEASSSPQEGNNDNQFGFSQSPSEPKINIDGIFNMDFQTPSQQPQENVKLEDILNINFQPSSVQQSQQKNDNMINMGIDLNMNDNFQNSPTIDNEE